MKPKELIFVIALAGGFIIPPIIGQQWFLLATFVTFFILFGLYEWLSVKMSNKSISQKVWQLRKDSAWKFWLIIGGMAAGWIALLWHFIDH